MIDQNNRELWSAVQCRILMQSYCGNNWTLREMSREELLWDHTGEELDDPLIGSYGTDEEEGVRYRYGHLLHDCMSMKTWLAMKNGHISPTRFKNRYTSIPRLKFITYNYMEWKSTLRLLCSQQIELFSLLNLFRFVKDLFVPLKRIFNYSTFANHAHFYYSIGVNFRFVKQFQSVWDLRCTTIMSHK